MSNSLVMIRLNTCHLDKNLVQEVQELVLQALGWNFGQFSLVHLLTLVHASLILEHIRDLGHANHFVSGVIFPVSMKFLNMSLM